MLPGGAGLGPAIHEKLVDPQAKPGDDGLGIGF